jgi:hypothetical protein
VADARFRFPAIEALFNSDAIDDANAALAPLLNDAARPIVVPPVPGIVTVAIMLSV